MARALRAAMEKTPTGTPVGVDDPYAVAGVCERCTSEGRCRYALDSGGDEAFTAERAADGYRCPAADPEGEWVWPDCPHYRDTTDGKSCARCGLEERRDAHGDGRPLVEEHHLRYRAEGEERDHEITRRSTTRGRASTTTPRPTRRQSPPERNGARPSNRSWASKAPGSAAMTGVESPSSRDGVFTRRWHTPGQ